jgi:hypothetical protein
LRILEQPDFPEFLPQQFGGREAEQLHHVRIHVGDFSRDGIDNEDPVSRGFKEPAIANFGSPQLLSRRLLRGGFVGLTGHSRRFLSLQVLYDETKAS